MTIKIKNCRYFLNQWNKSAHQLSNKTNNISRNIKCEHSTAIPSFIHKIETK